MNARARRHVQEVSPLQALYQLLERDLREAIEAHEAAEDRFSVAFRALNTDMPEAEWRAQQAVCRTLSTEAAVARGKREAALQAVQRAIAAGAFHG